MKKIYVRVICIKKRNNEILRSNSLALHCERTLYCTISILKKHSTFSFFFTAGKQVIIVKWKNRKDLSIIPISSILWSIVVRRKAIPCKNRKGECLDAGISVQWEQFLQYCLVLCRSARIILFRDSGISISDNMAYQVSGVTLLVKKIYSS